MCRSLADRDASREKKQCNPQTLHAKRRFGKRHFGRECLRAFPKTFTVPTSSANEAIFLHGLWGRWGPTSWVSPIAADLVVASYRMPVEPRKAKKRRHPRCFAKGLFSQQSRHGCRGVEGILGSRVRREPSHITRRRRARALGVSPARGQAPEGQCSLDSGACGVT